MIPYGGGTSVVGGVEPRIPGSFDGAVSLDLGALDRVLEVDPVSRAARIGAGASGPRLEEQLGAHGLTMRFYPQSFELSTLGGWIATRAAGHFATGRDARRRPRRGRARDHARAGRGPRGGCPARAPDPRPTGCCSARRGSSASSPRRGCACSRVPSHRAGRTVRFASFLAGAEAVRAVVQAGLRPANCRLIDALEAAQTGAGDGERAVLVLGFESTDHRRRARPRARARALPRARRRARRARAGARDGAGAWREAFLRMPYLRDMLVRLGVLSDTFETAITWERLPAFHEAVVGATRAALGERCRVTCRLTHVYPDGPAPYFTVLAPARRGDELEQWLEMKSAASDAILAAGGTITHHHAVGRDHRRWYDAQRPEPFAAALRAAKAAVDPKATPQSRGTLGSMSAEGKNFEAITKAKADHNARCPFPPHTVRMNPFEIERMQWEEGDTIAGLVLEGDPKVGTGAFRLVCDGMEPPELEIEEVEAISAPVEPLEVPVGPGPPRRADRLRVAVGSRGIGISGPNGAARPNLR